MPVSALLVRGFADMAPLRRRDVLDADIAPAPLTLQSDHLPPSAADIADARHRARWRRYFRLADFLVFVKPLIALGVAAWVIRLSWPRVVGGERLYVVIVPLFVAALWSIGYLLSSVRRKSTLRALRLVSLMRMRSVRRRRVRRGGQHAG